MYYRFYSDVTKTSKVRVTVIGTHSEGVLKVAVSRCSKKDNFIRKKGRLIAENRLNANKIYNEYPMAECAVKDFVNIAKTVAKEVEDTKIIYNVRKNVLRLLKNEGITEEELNERDLVK